MAIKAFKHFKTLCKHKMIVFHECKACGIPFQGLMHDMSKFSPAEFMPAAKYYQGNKSPIDAEKANIGYSLSWLHHKGHNKHHWEYWTDFDNEGNVVANRIPSKYVIEMVCDWIGAGKVYSKEKWTQKSPLEYYNKVRKGRYYHPETEGLILFLLVTIANKGLDEFHKICRQKYPVITNYDKHFIP